MKLNCSLLDRAEKGDARFFARPTRRSAFKPFVNPRFIMARFREVCSFAVPIGYEDEAGFHYGTPPQD